MAEAATARWRRTVLPAHDGRGASRRARPREPEAPSTARWRRTALPGHNGRKASRRAGELVLGPEKSGAPATAGRRRTGVPRSRWKLSHRVAVQNGHLSGDADTTPRCKQVTLWRKRAASNDRSHSRGRCGERAPHWDQRRSRRYVGRSPSRACGLNGSTPRIRVPHSLGPRFRLAVAGSRSPARTRTKAAAANARRRRKALAGHDGRGASRRARSRTGARVRRASQRPAADRKLPVTMTRGYGEQECAEWTVLVFRYPPEVATPIDRDRSAILRTDSHRWLSLLRVVAVQRVGARSSWERRASRAGGAWSRRSPQVFSSRAAR